ncbi:MAG: hypothetical protein ACOYJQ_03955 [Pseudochelatococcus sp.]|jgi:hypothetical protein|uniref:hypothetical protein n=1 Tax=Pseudochelatococcus sp. TaxID=2020869 RepID=UPI003D8EFB00
MTSLFAAGDTTNGQPQGDLRAATWNFLLVAVLVLVVFQPYYTGYRLSRDDVWFLKVGMEGLVSVRDHAVLVATEQGRIGQLLMLPLNVLGSLLAGNPLWRFVFLALYVIQLLLFATFVARLLRQHVALLLFLLLVVLHPLAFDNMPPNAYPLQNTVPFILVLASRLVILDRRQRETASRVAVGAAQAGFALGMFISEFAVALGTALLIAEYLARVQWKRTAGNTWIAAFRASFARRFLVSDALAACVALAPYALFRWLHPSIYAGNSIGGLLEPDRVFGTAFWHIVAGTPARFMREGLPPAEIPDVLAAIVVGAAVVFCLCRLIGPALRIRAPWAVAGVSLFLAIYMNLPIAISAKYQQECMEWSKCGYLDSRMSYLAVIVAVMCLFPIAGRLPFRRIALGGVCVALGAAAVFVSLHNAGQARQMRRFDTVWSRAHATACATPGLVDDEAAFTADIDPEGLVEMHPPSKPIEFWRVYIPWQAGRSCQNA